MNVKDVKISFIAPSHRTHLWNTFFDSIITNLDFEVIFVTDKIPQTNEIPKAPNFKWIYSEVKPAQCFEIAYRQSIGEFIIWTSDDFIYAPYALDNVYNMYRSFYDHKVIISFDVYEDGVEQTIRCHKLPWDDNIQLSTTALINKQAIEEVGGYGDINFVCGHTECDLIMRIIANGGRSYVCPIAMAYEPHLAFHKEEQNFATTWQQELDYFKSLWSINGKTTLIRQKQFMPYSLINLCHYSQGEKGKWK